jgi:hypothetical protein
MLFYGDAKRIEDPREKAARLGLGLERLAGTDLPVERKATLTELLVEAGELEQGLLDHDFEAVGEDRPSLVRTAASQLTRSIAEALVAAFRSLPQDLERIRRALQDLLGLDLPDAVSVSVPEGFAIYGLYPETYFQAAAEMNDGPLTVIGIRSIGTALAAVVAAAAGEEASAVSVRPVGHPFDRRLAVSNDLESELLGKTRYAVVDEGPGLSGSSFGCVADWLEERGVAPETILFFPSHRGGLGPHACERHQRRWERAQRFVTEFEEVFTGPDSFWPLARWAEDLTGPAEGTPEDLSAGRWRRVLIPDRSSWPAVDVQSERRKYLLVAGGRRWFLKFAGLGCYGREKLEMARVLAAERLIPPVAGLRHGFLVGPWLEGARPLPLVPGVDRRALLNSVARYLAFRISRLPAPSGSYGASPEKLLEMAAFNAGRALETDMGEITEEWRNQLPEIARLAKPILTDNKMHAWEWLVTPEGEILKADALDHHRSNDLVGPQDPAWDLAGAAVELDLDEGELDGLADALARRTGTPRARPVQLGFYRFAYLGFQIGRYTLAAEACVGSTPREAAALRMEAAHYAERLRCLVTADLLVTLPNTPGNA